MFALLLVAAAGCDSTAGRKQPSPSMSTKPTAAPTVLVPTNTDVTVKPPAGSLTAPQREVLAVYEEYIAAEYRFYSHPWFVDPVYARIVKPGSPFAPLATDTIGRIGSVLVEVRSVQLTGATKARVETCTDDRAVRYLGRNGEIDIKGPAGDKLRGGILEGNIRLEYTTEAAEDGSTSKTPRWLIAGGGALADDGTCASLAAKPPLTPTPRTPITATP
ncbi:hypothetical protein ACFCV3_13640 [Kribbella sp. NPDC056345]|uniref:hypothetical protein n=1 Tax=Kribbella sp. NPDC056345 TaxID=3345789 RepID=UPI0035DECD4C